MQKSAVYRKRAEQVRGLASQAITKQERASLLEIAATWDRLARQREEDHQLAASRKSSQTR
jgi:hypothetical protein